MSFKRSIRVPADCAGVRLDNFLSSRYDVGRSLLQRLFRQKDIWVYEAIQKMPDKDIVCFCDGFDSIICWLALP